MKNVLIVFFVTIFSVSVEAQQKLSKYEEDFETFWSTFKNHYAFFKLKAVNWDSTYSIYRPKVTSSTKKNEFIELLKQMVMPLNDGHVTISEGDEVLFKAKKPSYFKQEFEGVEKEFWNMSFSTLKQKGFSMPVGSGPLYKDNPLYYSAQTQELGYIRITRCFAQLESLFDEKKEAADVQLMLSLFDALLNKFAQKKAIVIDIRGNGGGHGGFELASRFAATRTLTHYISLKQPGSDEAFSAPAPQYIQPNNGVQYLKQIVILTNDRTASSAEDFAISLYQLPNVAVIGTNTSGMFSDMYEAKLSGKLSFTLSNQVYFNTQMKIIEDAGVPVKVEVKNSKQDIAMGIDPVIEKMMEFLASL